MLLRDVEYARPASVGDAVRLLSEHDGARALAGGQTLINVMKARAASPDVLVDLNDLEELKGIELQPDGTVELGAMATYTDVIESAEARARPILGEVCAQIADVQVRNRGTIGRDGTCIVSAAASVNGGSARVAIGCVDAVPILVEPSSTDADAVIGAVRD